MPVRFRGGGASGGGSAAPTVVVSDLAGPVDTLTQTFRSPDTTGAGDKLLTLAAAPSDVAGPVDTLTVTGTPKFGDTVGPRDTHVLAVTEAALPNSGTPDGDPWGDAWVNRAAVNAGDNHGGNPSLQISAVTAVTQIDSYAKIDFRRLTGLAWNGPSTLTFTATWPTLAGTPSQALNVDMRSSAASPWTQSTITANNRARFTSAGPYTQRAFSFSDDGTTRSCTITFTQAEVNDFLGKWLELQFTTPDLGAGTLTVTGRNNPTVANRASYTLALTE